MPEFESLPRELLSIICSYLREDDLLQLYNALPSQKLKDVASVAYSRTEGRRQNVPVRITAAGEIDWQRAFQMACEERSRLAQNFVREGSAWRLRDSPACYPTAAIEVVGNVRRFNWRASPVCACGNH
ncbi:hypothetical protein NDN08_002030 [Rhodosorus marinus]|uniref:F-box domain-containing protein n=1 Tax=Rhodosorus marinus TaxID=101924 RepID=A0AAV8USN1_9RHOD|nr:hypothetical protein NDN08_002030 [Rhodosorus marinus]